MSSNIPGGAPGDLDPIWTIEFNLRASLSRPINQPAIIEDPIGLVVFGDSSALYCAQVSDPGAGVYEKLKTIKATNYIHGWAVSTGRLYVLDGVELAAWDIRDGVKRESINLLVNQDAQQATTELAELQKAQQKVEWATLLELAEEDWVRVTAQQTAAAAGSEERDKLDKVVADSFQMLKSLREITGSTGGGVAARKLIGELRAALAKKRAEAAPYCFSPPIVRRRSFEEPQRAVFTVQGNGRLFACNQTLTDFADAKVKTHAEPYLALLEDQKTPLRVLCYVSDGVLQAVDAKTFAETSFWTPEPKPEKATTRSLTAVKDQIWWGTEANVYACQADDTGKLRPTFSSGTPWTTRQVGRLNAPDTLYKPPIDPNELFNTMNVHGWVEQRANKTAPLNDGALALLMLSNETGKYTSPPAGKSYLIHGPFERDAASNASRWTQVKPHHSGTMILLSDNRGTSSFCRYPATPSVSQLVPQWSVAPWFSSLTRYSAPDLALSQGWPTAVRRLPDKYEGMADLLRKSAADKVSSFETIIRFAGRGPSLLEETLRLVMWHVLIDSPIPSEVTGPLLSKDGKTLLDIAFDVTTVQPALRTRFGKPGTQWAMMSADEWGRNYSANRVANPKLTTKWEWQVNFDPPWVNKSVPATLFHSTPPLWYDPWGYNRPGDFVTDQPSVTYFDPFCFNGQLKVPHRRINFDTPFKVRSWAVFTDNDPAFILRTVKPPTAGGTPEPAPKPLRAAGDPKVFVVSTDEDRQRSTLRVLPAKLSFTTFDDTSHTFRSEAIELGSIP
ncbi:MAG TPA: hypothetical protein VFT02_00905, partial [Pyrinomonadaceae bacterium]|nr:hypothetical protein [Pyrinomonadaceae bacterium]